MCFNYDVFKDRSSLTLSMGITNRSQSTVPFEPKYQLCKILGRLSREEYRFGFFIWALICSVGKVLTSNPVVLRALRKGNWFLWIIFCTNRYHEEIFVWRRAAIRTLNHRTQRSSLDIFSELHFQYFPILHSSHVERCNYPRDKKNLVFAKAVENIASESCCVWSRRGFNGATILYLASGQVVAAW